MDPFREQLAETVGLFSVGVCSPMDLIDLAVDGLESDLDSEALRELEERLPRHPR